MDTYTILIETQGTWSFIVEPIVPGATFPMSGTGSFVSDFFELSVPTIVTIYANRGTEESLLPEINVQLVYPRDGSDGWTTDPLTHTMFYKFDESTFDAIMKPKEERLLCCIYVKCDSGVEWSINLK